MKTKLAKVLSLVLVCALIIGTCNVKAQAASSEGFTDYSRSNFYSDVTVTVEDKFGTVSGTTVVITLGYYNMKNHYKTADFSLVSDANGKVVLHVTANYYFVDSIKALAKDDGCHASEKVDKIYARLFHEYWSYIYADDYSTTITLKENHKKTVDVAGKEPTCTESGYTAGKKCDKCGTVIEGCEVIPATGHKFGGWLEILSDENEYYQVRECSKCDEVESRKLTYEETAPTCTLDGSFKYVTGDYEVVSEGAIKATGHTEVIDEAVAPTCTETGLNEGKHCSVCEEVLDGQEEVAALDHDWTEWEVKKEATTTEKGLKERNCQREDCDTCETEEIPMIKVTPNEPAVEPADEPKTEPKTEPENTTTLPILPADYGKKSEEVEEEVIETVEEVETAQGDVEEEPVAKEPVAEEPVAEEPAAEEPAVEEPVAEEPVAEEPVVEEEVIEDIEVVETAQGDVDDEEEDIELDDIITPQGDVLPQTGVASAALFLGLGAACIGFGGAIVAKARKKED